MGPFAKEGIYCDRKFNISGHLTSVVHRGIESV